jgi:hypothetical protein
MLDSECWKELDRILLSFENGCKEYTWIVPCKLYHECSKIYFLETISHEICNQLIHQGFSFAMKTFESPQYGIVVFFKNITCNKGVVGEYTFTTKVNSR